MEKTPSFDGENIARRDGWESGAAPKRAAGKGGAPAPFRAVKWFGSHWGVILQNVAFHRVGMA